MKKYSLASSLCILMVVFAAISTSHRSGEAKEESFVEGTSVQARGDSFSDQSILNKTPTHFKTNEPARDTSPNNSIGRSRLTSLMAPIALINDTQPSFYLSFPLPNRTAYTAIINSVFDHYAPNGYYHPDNKIIAFTGETGQRNSNGSNGASVKDFGFGMLYGFTNNTVAYPFVVNGNYSDPHLFYDSHDGIDFKTTDQGNGKIDVLAAADGDLTCVANSAFNTVRIDHTNIDRTGNGYRTEYLHMSTRNCGLGHVMRGQIIGTAGGVGASADGNSNIHLHFSVFLNGQLVDPYGWQGQYQDPRFAATGVANTNLWKPQAYTATLITDNHVRWHPDGALLSSITDSNHTVWLIQGGKKRGITSSDIFRAYGFDFANVINVSPDELDCYLDGGTLGMPPSSRLVNAGGTIYEITDRNRKRGFAPALLVSGREIFSGGAVLQGQGFRWDDVVLESNAGINVASITDDPDVPVYKTPFRDGTLIALLDTSVAGQRRITQNTPVYIISNAKKRPFVSGNTFTVMGYRFDDVMTVSQDVLDSIPNGDPINELDPTQCHTIIAAGDTDFFAPTLTINTPSDGQTVNTNTVTVSGTASDLNSGNSGITSITVNGVRASGDTAIGTATANWSRVFPLNQGSNTITVVATDGSINQNSTSKTITVSYPPSNPTPTPTQQPTPSPSGVYTLATGLSNPNGIATDGSEVFWTDSGSNSVKKVSVNGGAVTTLFSGPYNPSGIGIDSNYVYFGTGVDLQKIPKNGGSSTSLASGLVTRLVVDGTNVYWTNYSSGTIQKVSVNGGTATTLASGLSSPMGITRAGNNVCWSESNNPGAIRCVGINGGAVSVLANNSNTPGIAADATSVYWTENVLINSGKVNKAPISGGASSSLATGLNYPWDIAVDSTSAYWVEDNSSGAVKQVSLTGGTPNVLASSLADPIAIAIDNSNVYWIERADGGQGTGTLKKVAKVTVPGSVPLDFAWQFKNSMPQGRSNAAVAVYNNQIYVIGGDYLFSHYRYDPSANSWSSLTGPPGNGISEGGATVVGNKIYAIGNLSETRIKIYDPASDSWSLGASMSAQIVRGPSVVGYNGKVYVIGGADNSLNAINTVRVYDPATDSWTNKTSMPTARAFASAVMVNNLIYVIGGLDSNTQPNIKSAVEVYNPATDTWTTKNLAPSASYIAAFTALNNRIYIIGGGNGSTSLNTVNEYDPASDSWRSLSNIQTPRYEAVAGAVNNRIYVMGGGDPGNALSSVEEGVSTGAAPSVSVSPKSQTMNSNEFKPFTVSISAAQSSTTNISLTSSNNAVITVPSTLSIQAGDTSIIFLARGVSPGTATISAKLPNSLGGGVDSATATVLAGAPTVTTTAAGTVTTTSVTLGGTINPNGTATNASFEWGTDPNLSSYNNTAQQSIGSGTNNVIVQANLSGLTPNTIYYFRAVGSNSAGIVRGTIKSFSTLACTYSISPTSQSFTASGGSGSITLASGTGCAWAASSNANFITVTSSANGSGNGTVNYSVAANPNNTPRSGTLTVASQTFTVNQDAASTTPRVNFALVSNGGVASASSTTPDSEFPGIEFHASSANDGDRVGRTYPHNGFWRDDTANVYPDWLQIDFNGSKTINEIDLFSLQDNFDTSPIEPTETQTFSINGLTGFDIQYWNGSSWVTIPGGSVTSNNKVWRKFSFSDITTNKIRVLINNALNSRSRVVEIEAYGGPQSRSNFALAANGGVTSASSTTLDTEIPGYEFHTSSANDGDRAGLTYPHNAFWRDGTSSVYPDWLQIDFNGSKSPDEIDVFTLQDNIDTVSPVEPTESMTFTQSGITAFDVQYWNGASWIGVPGGSVTGNNKVWRKFNFASITTSKIRVLVNSALTNRSRIVEVETWGTVSTSTNVALASNGGVVTASSTTPDTEIPGYEFHISSANDGDRAGLTYPHSAFWRDGTANLYPDWLQIDFNGSKTINEIDVFSLQDNIDTNVPVAPNESMVFSQSGITDFDVQYWNGTSWVNMPGGSVAGNNKVWRKFTFTPITTSKVRVLVNNALNSRSRIVEVEAWGN